ncbi:helix-turn-helix transcriptional regulator [Caulobacter sp. LARHSG274]
MDGSHPAAALNDTSIVRFCLDQDDVALVVVDRHANLIWRSRAAALLLAGGGAPLIDRGGRVMGVDRRAQQFLIDRIAEALIGQEVCQFIDSDLDRRFLLRVRSVSEDGVQALVIIIKDFDAPAHLPKLELLFGLSAMEARILHEIIEGNSAERIAESKGVSIQTVRTHIKHIHSKMEVRSKEEILATIVKIFA